MVTLTAAQRRPNTRAVKVLLAVAVSLLLVSGCVTEHVPDATPTRTLGPGEQWVPVAPVREVNGQPVLCAGAGFGGYVLTGSPSDPRVVWMMAGSKRYDLEWPVGYSARFTPQLELLDGNGIVVAREGTQPTGGCPMGSPNIWDVELPA